MKKVIAPVVSFLMLIFLPAAVFSAAVKYEVWVQTGSAKGADTSAAISIVLTNEAGTSSPELALKNSSTNKVPFGAGKLDKFILQIDADLGPIKTITLKSNNAGKEPEWQLEGVKVYYSPPSGKSDPRFPVDGRRNVTNFRYGDWIDKNKKLAVTLNTTDKIAGAASPQGAPFPPPSRLAATAQSTSVISLSWVDATRGQAGFKIERSASATGGFAEIGTMPAGKAGFASSGLAPNTTYYFRVRAYRDNAHSAYSAVISATTPALQPPAAPSNLKALRQQGNKINLSWNDNSNNETSFEIEQSTIVNGGYLVIGTANADSRNFVAQGLLSRTTYYFKIRARNAIGYSTYSNVVAETTYPNPPWPPSNLSARAESGRKVRLSWANPVPNDASAVKIERSTQADSGFGEIALVAPAETSYVATGQTSGTRYFFRVRAWNDGGHSGYSYVATVEIAQDPLLPPRNLTIAVHSGNKFYLTWQRGSLNESEFIVEKSYSSNTGFYELIPTVNGNTTTYGFVTNNLTTMHYFRVKAKNSGGYSGYSNTVSAKILNPPRAPSNLRAAAQPGRNPTLTWEDNSIDEIAFDIEYKKQGSAEFRYLCPTNANIASFSITYTGNENSGFVAGAEYEFRVRARNDGGDSEYSNVASATIQSRPNPPSNVVASLLPGGAVQIAWTDSSTNEAGFTVDKYTVTSQGGETNLIRSTVNANTTSFTSQSLAAGATYRFKIYAFNDGGVSAQIYSNQIQIPVQ